MDGIVNDEDDGTVISALTALLTSTTNYATITID